MHPPAHKELTEERPIEALPLPRRVVLPVHQNLGAPAKVVVEKRAAVKVGQVIAEAAGFVSAPVHATVSGRVKNVGPYPTSVGGTSLCVEIEADGEDAWVEGVDLGASALPEALGGDIPGALAAAGLVGLGGAAFPTHVKLRPPADARIDTLILNGAECEPYLTADDRLMREHAREVAQGLRLLMAALRVERGLVGIEDNKPDAIAAMVAAARELRGVAVVPCRTRYPQGAEKQLIQALLGREVPPGKLPLHVGVVVQNVGTAFAAFEAVARRKPLVERVLTVSGRAIRAPKNLRVRIGTLLSDVVAFCGGVTEGLRKVIMGGPMMGKALRYDDVPVLKSTSGLLFFDEAEARLAGERACIRCGRCVQVCPQGLVPADLGALAEHGLYDRMADALDCVECGSCQFVCPANRRLVHWIRLGKSEIRLLRQATG